MAAASVFTLNQIRLACRKKLLRLCTDKCKVNRPNVQQQMLMEPAATLSAGENWSISVGAPSGV